MEYPPIDPEQPCFIRVPVKTLVCILAALRANNFEAEAKAVELFSKDYTDPEANAERERWIEIAHGETPELTEQDSDSTISHSDDGTGQYVLSWVWVEDPNASEDSVDDLVETATKGGLTSESFWADVWTQVKIRERCDCIGMHITFAQMNELSKTKCLKINAGGLVTQFSYLLENGLDEEDLAELIKNHIEDKEEEEKEDKEVDEENANAVIGTSLQKLVDEHAIEG